jgi:hypothetical protein
MRTWVLKLLPRLRKPVAEPAPIFRQPDPASRERMLWASRRVYVLDRCVKDLTRRQNFYQRQGLANANVQAEAMQTMQAERLLLLIELNVLNDIHQEKIDGS